jgi:hypothetical protein
MLGDTVQQVSQKQLLLRSKGRHDTLDAAEMSRLNPLEHLPARWREDREGNPAIFWMGMADQMARFLQTIN